MKPKQNQKSNPKKSHTFDRCQTPYYALDPLIPYLSATETIWEPAAGDGQIAQKLISEGFEVVATDILDGHDFFMSHFSKWGCQVTNPPYSIKYEWLEYTYQLEKPFALLLPLETLGAAKGQRLFEHYGIEIILLDKRVNFKMPYKGYTGNGAQFPTAWFTWGLEIGKEITFAKIRRYNDQQMFLGII